MDYFIADTHFGHSNILKHCHRMAFMTGAEREVMENGDSNAIENLRISWESTQRMDQNILDNINSTVGEKDRLIHLGDFAWVRGEAEKIAEVFAKYRNQIKCRNVVLIWGNHDPKQFSAGRNLIEKASVFSTTADLLTIHIGGFDYFLSHYANALWDKRHYGARNLYGHSHAMAESWMESIMPGRYSMDVGIDNAYRILGNYRPFSIQEIERIMELKPGFGMLGKQPAKTKWFCTHCTWEGTYEDCVHVMYRGRDWENCPNCNAAAFPEKYKRD